MDAVKSNASQIQTLQQSTVHVGWHRFNNFWWNGFSQDGSMQHLLSATVYWTASMSFESVSVSSAGMFQGEWEWVLLPPETEVMGLRDRNSKESPQTRPDLARISEVESQISKLQSDTKKIMDLQSEIGALCDKHELSPSDEVQTRIHALEREVTSLQSRAPSSVPVHNPQDAQQIRQLQDEIRHLQTVLYQFFVAPFILVVRKVLSAKQCVKVTVVQTEISTLRVQLAAKPAQETQDRVASLELEKQLQGQISALRTELLEHPPSPTGRHEQETTENI
eukprot:gene18344-5850_t